MSILQSRLGHALLMSLFQFIQVCLSAYSERGSCSQLASGRISHLPGREADASRLKTPFISTPTILARQHIEQKIPQI